MAFRTFSSLQHLKRFREEDLNKKLDCIKRPAEWIMLAAECNEFKICAANRLPHQFPPFSKGHRTRKPRPFYLVLPASANVPGCRQTVKSRLYAHKAIVRISQAMRPSAVEYANLFVCLMWHQYRISVDVSALLRLTVRQQHSSLVSSAIGKLARVRIAEASTYDTYRCVRCVHRHIQQFHQRIRIQLNIIIRPKVIVVSTLLNRRTPRTAHPATPKVRTTALEHMQCDCRFRGLIPCADGLARTISRAIVIQIDINLNILRTLHTHKRVQEIQCLLYSVMACQQNGYFHRSYLRQHMPLQGNHNTLHRRFCRPSEIDSPYM